MNKDFQNRRHQTDSFLSFNLNKEHRNAGTYSEVTVCSRASLSVFV